MGAPHVSDEGLGEGHNMRDINDEEFLVGDYLKVIKFTKCSADLKVGDVVECIYNDDTSVCEFKLLSTNQKFYYYNDHLQKL